MTKEQIENFEKEFEALKNWASETISYFTEGREAKYNDATLAKAIGVNPKSIIFTRERSENMNIGKYIAIAKGLERLQRQEG